jgi:hypothetical protein
VKTLHLINAGGGARNVFVRREGNVTGSYMQVHDHDEHVRWTVHQVNLS